MTKSEEREKNIPYEFFVFYENIENEVNLDISRNISKMKIFIWNIVYNIIVFIKKHCLLFKRSNRIKFLWNPQIKSFYFLLAKGFEVKVIKSDL